MASVNDQQLDYVSLAALVSVNFDRFLKIYIFFDFHSKKCSFKANASHDKLFVFWRKQIMSINQAYDRLYSDKVSKF